MRLAAPVGTLDEPVKVRITEIALPDGDQHDVYGELPDYLRGKRVGEVYGIVAQDSVVLSGERYLLLGLPIPDGVDVNTLSVASWTPPRQIRDGGSGHTWSTSRGAHDSSSALFGTVLPALMAEDAADAPKPYLLVNDVGPFPIAP